MLRLFQYRFLFCEFYYIWPTIGRRKAVHIYNDTFYRCSSHVNIWVQIQRQYLLELSYKYIKTIMLPLFDWTIKLYCEIVLRLFRDYYHLTSYFRRQLLLCQKCTRLIHTLQLGSIQMFNITNQLCTYTKKRMFIYKHNMYLLFTISYS